MINIADLPDPNDPQGGSYRQVNADKAHSIRVGALVELESGVRMFVVWQGRDCDQTPLYWLSSDRDDTERNDATFMNHGWHGGYSEDGLKVIRE